MINYCLFKESIKLEKGHLSATERQMDQLYNLTPEEIAIVENQT